MKTCTHCGDTKPLNEFHKSNRATGERATRGGGGVDSVCKPCRAEKRSPGIHARREGLRLDQQNQRDAGLKRCSDCHLCKPFAAFMVAKHNLDGLNGKCRECRNAYKHRYDVKNPSAFSDWYQQNKERRSADFRAYREKHKDRLKQNFLRWAQNNKHMVTALSAKRKARKMQATPSWANMDAIKAIYAEAGRMSRQTGIPHHVDHIYPLDSEFVCGLHCEANLQILTRVENIRKHNRMPTAAYAAI